MSNHLSSFPQFAGDHHNFTYCNTHRVCICEVNGKCPGCGIEFGEWYSQGVKNFFIGHPNSYAHYPKSCGCGPFCTPCAAKHICDQHFEKILDDNSEKEEEEEDLINNRITKKTSNHLEPKKSSSKTVSFNIPTTKEKELQEQLSEVKEKLEQAQIDAAYFTSKANNTREKLLKSELKRSKLCEENKKLKQQIQKFNCDFENLKKKITCFDCDKIFPKNLHILNNNLYCSQCYLKKYK